MWAANSRWKKVSLSLQSLSESVRSEMQTHETQHSRKSNQRPIRYERLQERKLFAADLTAADTFQMTYAATQAAQYGPQPWNPATSLDSAINDLVQGQFSATSGQAAVPTAIASMYGDTDNDSRSMCVGDLVQNTLNHINQLQSSIAQYQQLMGTAPPDLIPQYQAAIESLNTQVAQAQAFLDYLNQVCGTSGSHTDNPLDYDNEDVDTDWNGSGTSGTSHSHGTSNDGTNQNTSGSYGDSTSHSNDDSNNNGSTQGTYNTSFTSGTKSTSGTKATSGTNPTQNTNGTSSTQGTDSSQGTDQTNGTSNTSGTRNTSNTSNTQGTGSTSGSSGSDGNTRGSNSTQSGNQNSCPGESGFTIANILSPSGPVVEGQEFGFGAKVCGLMDSTGRLINPPDASAWIDFNFNELQDAGEIFNNIHIDPLHHTLSVTGFFADDGPFPGNGTPSDIAKAYIRLEGQQLDTIITVVNQTPFLASEPNIAVNVVNGAGGLVTYNVSVNAAIIDDGKKDLHRMKIEWFDGQQVITPWIESNNLTGFYTVTFNRNEAPFAHKPLKLTFEDDDDGRSVFYLDSLDVPLNNNDSNHNSNLDYYDNPSNVMYVPFGDPDLIKLDVESVRKTLGNLPEEGRVVIDNDHTGIVLWGSQDKTRSIPDLAKDWVNRPVQVWAEGVMEGPANFSISYVKGETRIPLATFRAFVWGLDLDIDSDNNNLTALPEQSAWEEELEDHEYGLGKLIYPHEEKFTPAIIQLPAGINPALSNVRIRLEFERVGTSGSIDIWNLDIDDPKRIAAGISPRNGGNMLFPGQEYTLAELNYDQATGKAIIYIDSIDANKTYYTKQGVDLNGKPNDRIKAILVTNELAELGKDEVKYLSTDFNSIYSSLQTRREVRTAISSEAAYSLTSSLQPYCQERLDENGLREAGFSQDFIDRVGAPANGAGYKSAVFYDYIDRKYIIAFAGTENAVDVGADIVQALHLFHTQYDLAIDIGKELASMSNAAI